MSDSKQDKIFDIKCKNSKHDAFMRFKYLKELSNVKSQVDLNRELNKKTAEFLNNFKASSNTKFNSLSSSHKENSIRKQELFNLSKSAHKKRTDILSLNKNISKINNDLISYVKLKQNYMQHDNYWKQSWLFTDNPIFEFGNLLLFF